MALLIKNAAYLVRDADRVERDADLLIKGNRICKVGSFDPEWLDNNEDCEVIDASHQAVIPGLINAHSHLYQNLLKGKRDDLPLVEWCGQVTFPLCQLVLRQQDSGDEDLGYFWSLLASMEMLKNGTTTCLNQDLTMDAVFQGWKEIGIRGIGAVTCADMWIPETLTVQPAKLQERVTGFIEKWHLTPASAPFIYTMFGPSAPFVCSEELLGWIREQATARELNIHIHVAETRYEVELMQREKGCRPLEYLDKIGFLGPDVSAAHCIHLAGHELELLKKQGVVPVHNPKSNMKLASGIAPVAQMLAMEIEVALGNDGSASNDNQDMFEEMRCAALLQKIGAGDAAVFTAKEAFRMATQGGAAACGIEAGTIDAGKLADVVLVNLDRPHLTPGHDVINMLVYCARGSDVDTVLVNGRVVVQNGQVRTVPEKEVLEEARKVIATKLQS